MEEDNVGDNQHELPSGNVIQFPGTYYPYTTEPLSPQKVIDAAQEELETVIVLGWDKDGYEYFASSTPSAIEALYLLERAKFKINRILEDANS